MYLRFIALFVFMFISAVQYGQEIDSVNVEYYEEEYQEESDEEFTISKVKMIDASLSSYFPTGAFADKIDNKVLIGFSLTFLKQLQLEKPAFIGFELSHMHIDGLRRTYAQLVSTEIIDISGRMSSNSLGINVLGRYYPSLKLGRVEPFMEGHFGGKFLYSYLSESGVFSDNEEYSSIDYLDNSFTLAYGASVGFQIEFSADWYISLKGTYQSTISSSYQAPISDDANVFPLLPRDGFELVKSTTDNLKLDIGVTYLY